MAKITLTDPASISNESSFLATIAANNALIEAAIENTLSRDGTTPNTLTASLDANSNRIINLPAPSSANDAARKADIDALDITILTAAVTDDVAEAAASAAAAAASASTASTAATNAAASYDSFDDRYLGAKAADPTLDNDGGALLTGALYFNTVSTEMRVYDGASWVVAYNPSADSVDTVFGRTGAVVAATSDYDAVQVDFTPAGTVAATNVQAAIEEVSGDVTTLTATVATKAALGAYAAVNTQTASYTFVLTDAGKVVEANHATNAIVFTVPPNASVAFPTGSQIDIVRYGAGTLTVAAGAGVTIRSKGSVLTLDAVYSGATLYKRATNEWVLVGDLG